VAAPGPKTSGGHPMHNSMFTYTIYQSMTAEKKNRWAITAINQETRTKTSGACLQLTTGMDSSWVQQLASKRGICLPIHESRPPRLLVALTGASASTTSSRQAGPATSDYNDQETSGRQQTTTQIMLQSLVHHHFLAARVIVVHSDFWTMDGSCFLLNFT
jgi:hypothetical protein